MLDWGNSVTDFYENPAAIEYIDPNEYFENLPLEKLTDGTRTVTYSESRNFLGKWATSHQLLARIRSANSPKISKHHKARITERIDERYKAHK